MSSPIYSRPAANRFLGNTSTTEVHDLRNEKVQCQINEIIRANHAVVFSPDTLVQARSEGFDNCAYCNGGSLR